MGIEEVAYPRVGLIGNPSDGYFGRVISFVFGNFQARVILRESQYLELIPNERDHSSFSSIETLHRDVQQYGYYGGIRLLKAAVKRFFEHAREQGWRLHGRNFTLSYSSDIPHQVGLAGSSAIVIACLRALIRFYDVAIPPHVLAGLALAVENEELGISAGLQDRVAQAFEGLVFMDFDREHMERHGYGRYEPLAPDLLPPLYVAYRVDLSEESGVFHNDLRARWNRGDPEVARAMREWADLATAARACLLEGRAHDLGPLLNANFDLRRRLCRISDGNIAMVEAARSVGASAKFTGSGGAIVGTCADEAQFEALQAAIEPLGARVIRPRLIPPRRIP